MDEYAAELSCWFGVPNDNKLEEILPNVRNFYSSSSSAPPVGFLLGSSSGGSFRGGGSSFQMAPVSKGKRSGGGSLRG